MTIEVPLPLAFPNQTMRIVSLLNESAAIIEPHLACRAKRYPDGDIESIVDYCKDGPIMPDAVSLQEVQPGQWGWFLVEGPTLIQTKRRR